MVKRVIPFLLFVCIFFVFVNRIDDQPFFKDEAYWINSVIHLERSLSSDKTDKRAWAGYFDYDQPPVGRYLISLALWLGGQRNEIKSRSFFPSYDTRVSLAENQKRGAVPAIALLRAPRIMSALFGAMTCLLIFLIGRDFLSELAGLIASLLLAFHPIMMTACRRAITDMPLLFFMTLCLYLLIYFSKSLCRGDRARTLLLSASIGLFAALATATKLNGALAVVLFVVFCVISLILDRKKTKTVILCIILFISVYSVNFIIVNPYLYQQPVIRIKKMYNYRVATVHSQMDEYGPSLVSPKQRIRAVFRNLLVPYSRQLITPLFIFRAAVILPLFFAGILFLMRREWRYIRFSGESLSGSAALIWTLINFIWSFSYIYLDWDRYFIPLLPMCALLTGLGLAWVLKNLTPSVLAYPGLYKRKS